MNYDIILNNFDPFESTSFLITIDLIRGVDVFVDGQAAARWTVSPNSQRVVLGYRTMKTYAKRTYSKFQFSDDSIEQDDDSVKDQPDAGTIEIHVHKVKKTKKRKSAKPILKKTPVKQVKLSATSKKSFHTQITTKPGEEIVVTKKRSPYGYMDRKLLYKIKCYYKPRFWLEHAGIIK